MTSHPLNPVPPAAEPHPDPADPLLNPPPLPGHAPQDLPPRQPSEVPVPDTERPQANPGIPASHPLGPPVPHP